MAIPIRLSSIKSNFSNSLAIFSLVLSCSHRNTVQQNAAEAVSPRENKNTQNSAEANQNSNSTAINKILTESPDTVSTSPNFFRCDGGVCRLLLQEFSVLEKKQTLDIGYLAFCEMQPAEQLELPLVFMDSEIVNKLGDFEFESQKTQTWKVLTLANLPQRIYLNTSSTVFAENLNCTLQLKFRRAELSPAIYEF